MLVAGYHLMVPIEIISHLARMLSLTVRLYANMFAGDMVTMVFFSLVPIGVPILFLGLAYRGVVAADLYFCPADHGVSGGRGRGRALTTVSSFEFLVSSAVD